jgi:hypothetical protein
MPQVKRHQHTHDKYCVSMQSSEDVEETKLCMRHKDGFIHLILIIVVLTGISLFFNHKTSDDASSSTMTLLCANIC